MSTEQENFDDILRSKLSEGEFEFNEANWDKAEALIIQADKKRKRRRIGFIFFIGLILGVCLMVPFIGDKKESLTNENKKNNAEKKDVSIDNNTKVESKETGKGLITQQEGNKPSDFNVKENKHADALQTKENEIKVNAGINPAKEDKFVNINSPKKNIANNALVPSTKKETDPINTESLQGGNATNDALVSNPTKNKTLNTEKQKSRSKGINSNNTPSNKKENESFGNKDIKKESKQEQVATKSKESQPLSKTTDTAQAPVITNNNIIKDSIIAVKDSIAKVKPDSVKPIAKDSTKDAKKENLKQTTVFCIDAGASYALGWKYNTTKEAAGFNAVLGASVMHYFNTKWSILVGLQYNSLSHLSYSSYSGSNTQLGFGYTTSYTTITPKMFYYIAMPLKWQYHINENNGISLGVNILYLLNTSSTVDTYAQTDFTTSKHATVTKRGYMDGFSTLDIQPALAYRRRIYKNFSVSAEAYYGLMDIKSNSFFGINKSERNNGLKLTLSYNFIK